MKTTTLLLIALLISSVGCSTWQPDKTVTLHDVDGELATVEGSDLRYRVATKPDCDGARGCRDVVTASEALQMYRWQALCDSKFCDSVELRYVELIREAAEIAFTTEQAAAATKLLARQDTVGEDRARLELFVSAAMEGMVQRIQQTEGELAALPLEDSFNGPAMRRDAALSVKRARGYLARALSLTVEIQKPQSSKMLAGVHPKS